jgi:hypothetical protein
MAKLVIAGPFLRVIEDLISLVDLFELLLSCRVFVAVGMIFQSLLSEALSHFLFRRTFGYS